MANLFSMKYARLYILVILLAPVCSKVNGQIIAADSLLRLITAAKEDTIKVHLLYSLSDALETSEPVKAIGYSQQGEALSKALKFEEGIRTAYRNLGYIYAHQGKYDSMLYYNKLVYDLALQHKDSFRIGVALFNLGESYKLLGDYEKGIEHTLKGVNMLEGKGHANIETNLYSGLQSTYLMLKQYNKSVEYGLKAIESGRKLADKSALLTVLVNLANCYVDMKDFKSAINLYQEAIPLAQTLKNTSAEAIALEGLFDIAMQQNNYSDAKTYVDRSLILHTQIGHNSGIAAANSNLSLYWLHQKDFAKAQAYAKEGLKIVRANNYTDIEGEVLTMLASAYLAGHEFDSAAKYEQESKEINERIFTDALAQKETDMRVKYETEKKEVQIQLQQSTLKQQAIINYTLAGAALTLLVIAILGYRNFKHRQTIQQQQITELKTDRQLAATEAVLKGEEQERARIAKDLHDGLGGMLSGIKHSFSNMKENLIMTSENAKAFKRGIDLLDDSIKEMRRVAHNMMPEILMQNGLTIALRELCIEVTRSSPLQATYQPIDMDKFDFTQNVSVTAYRVVQELTTNAVKHSKASTLLVQAHASADDNLLQLTVEDNGVGFERTLLKEAAGMGWKSILNRVELLKGKIDISSVPGSGTSVLIEIPLS